jgi:hypothetical protein
MDRFLMPQLTKGLSGGRIFFTSATNSEELPLA